ncbi:protease inhibitor I42 family protein [Streptomyces spinoverrucosus]|uniref:protease inhibitor I42 family protein n=1 Tax=Streptomyces spinoverrucosus TaxID=284043 RepID=UPI0018C42417|nr:protease inhibitor I42 family protein [Streptomyces spinoverrucosus]MBG0854517.1 protease inhibitor I42 family protein [Streptomyces spinoverrucosus]
MAAAFGAAALLVLTAGCGSGDEQPTSHPTQDTTIEAAVGERFTLTVNENASTRSHWYLVDPKPDSAVVRAQGRETGSGGEEMPGADSELTFTFEATGKGSTEIVLMHCTFTSTCDKGDGTPAPTPTGGAAPTEPERVTYRVTVE